MKQTRFLARIKLQVPNIKESGVDDDDIMAIANEGCDVINLLAKIYRGTTGGYTDFNIVADQGIYSLAAIAPTFLALDDKPLHFKNSDGEWKKVYPKTKAWIEKVYPNWMNADSAAIPQWYWAEGDELGMYPPPSTSYTKGARLYHLKTRTDMANGDSYPFSGNATQLTALIPMDDAIIAYVRWKLSPAVGSVTDVDLREREFYKEVQKGARQIKRRPDIAIEPSNVISIC